MSYVLHGESRLRMNLARVSAQDLARLGSKLVGSGLSLAKKLQIPAGQSVCLISPPAGFEIDAPVSSGTDAFALLLFARDAKSLMSQGKPVFEAAKRDGLAWIAYPKAGQLGTDLNRDKLSELMKPKGIQPVRLVSLDETWSAMRFSPG
jgi:hypothetical protein